MARRHDAPADSDAALLADRADPAESFSRFYRRHSRAILALCARRGLSPHDAADAAADIFVAALAGRYRFSPGVDPHQSAVPWLYGIAANVLNGRHRRTAREQAAHDRLERLHLSEPDVAEYLELRDQVDAALAAIAELPPEQRSAVLGRHLEDAAYVELAERHGVSEQAMRQRVSRALGTVRRRMGGQP